MKKYFILILGILVNDLFGQTDSCQNCYGNKGISTNPSNPQNCELTEAFSSSLTNPYLNTWNWANNVSGQFSLIPLNPSAGWQIPAYYNPYAPLNMHSPFYQGFLAKPAGTPVADFDFHWEDGWELLFRNTGYLPNGQEYQSTITNSIVGTPLALQNQRVPYFILYNRYNGKLRLFFNVFSDLSTFDHINLDLGYVKYNSNTNTSGILRMGAGYDIALDQKSEINFQSAHFENINNINKWFMSEIQTAYDPCVCNYFSELNLKIKGISNSTLDLTGRSIATTLPLRDGSGNPTYSNFLTINTQQENGGQGSGYAIYKTLDGMLNDYDNELKEYKDKLADYNSVGNATLRSLMGLAKTGLNAGLTGLVPSSILTGLTSNAVRVVYKNTKKKDYNNAKQWAYSLGNPTPYLTAIKNKPEGEKAYEAMLKDSEKYSQELSKTLKGGLGSLSDNLFATFYTEPEKPTTPTMPVATLSEMKIVGTLTKLSHIEIGNLYTPGAFNLPKYNPNITPNSINFNAFPIYNEPLGLFAMLETPSIKFENKLLIKSNKTFFIPLFKLNNPLKYRFNHGLNFNFNKTELHGQFVLEILTQTVPVLNNGNIKILHIIPGNYNNATGNYNYKTTLVTDWYPYEMLGTILFGGEILTGNIGADFILSKIQFKTMADMYFSSKSYDDKEINTVNILTYELFNIYTDIDLILTKGIWSNNFSQTKEYSPGKLVLNNEKIEPTDTFVFKVVGNIIFIKQNEIYLKGNITVDSGFEVIMQAFWGIETDSFCTIDPTITLEGKQDFYNFPETKEVTNTELLNYCTGQNKKYKANQYNSAPPPIIEPQKEEEKTEALALKLLLQPNPANNEVQIIVLNKTEENVLLDVFDMQGRKVYSQALSNVLPEFRTPISTANWNNGLYLIKITEQNSKHSSIQKLVVNHQ